MLGKYEETEVAVKLKNIREDGIKKFLTLTSHTT